MKQCKGRNGRSVFLAVGVCLSLMAALFYGCKGGDRAAILAGDLDGDVDLGPVDNRGVGLNSVTPSNFKPGSIVELHGHGFPGRFEDIRVRFSRLGDRQGTGILAYPFRVTSNLISVIVPTGVSSGLCTLQVKEGGDFLELASQATSVGPQLMGYRFEDTARFPGVLDVHPITGLDPSTVLLYGTNINTGVISAVVEVLSVDRSSSKRFPDTAIAVSEREITIPGVTDAAVKAVRLTLPEDIKDEINTEGVVYYIRITVRGGSMVSNAIELPAVMSSTSFGADFQLPWPATISGVWASPGVHGNLVEVFYTIFQPKVSLKWAPRVEYTVNSGSTWEQLPDGALVLPSDGADGSPVEPVDFRDHLVIAGDGRQTPEKTMMTGPGLTYRLYINVAVLEAIPPPTPPDLPIIDPTILAGSLQLRMRMFSEAESHGEIDPQGNVSIPTRIEGNNLEIPLVAVAAQSLARAGEFIEEFESRENFADRDLYTRLNSTGLWAQDGVATGKLTAMPITGSGTEELVLMENRAYLFDTNVGKLYIYPEGASEGLIHTVRGELSVDPANRSASPAENLELLWDGRENPGAGDGELHVSRLGVPATSRLFARGARPLTVRASGEEGGLAAVIDGEINVDGLPGGDGGADSTDGEVEAEKGSGGVAGPGGGFGGDGGLVRTGFVGLGLGVKEALPAEPGDWGGGAGQTMTYVLPEYGTTQTKKCFVYGGAGGGGGFGGPGTMGREGTRTDGTNNWQNETANNAPWTVAPNDFGAIIRVNGTGGAVRGSEELIPLLTGAGGGGGGGFLARQAVDQSTRIFGVGGGGGGGGGGAFQLVAKGLVQVRGKIFARGGAGGVGRGKPLAASGAARTRGDWSGSCGGGGSGGAILIRTTDSLVFDSGAELDISGGLGGVPGVTDDDRYLSSEKYPLGGDGGRGRIRLEAGRGVNLPSNIDLEGVFPEVVEGGPTEIGPILKPVNGGDGSLGTLNLEDFIDVAVPDPSDPDSLPTVYISAQDGVIYLFAAGAPDERVNVRTLDAEETEFHFASLFIPEGMKLKGQGSEAIVIRIQGSAEIEGVIDIKGRDGHPVTVGSDGFLVLGGGGAAGAGGGGGGQAGFGSRLDEEWEISDGRDGQLPSGLPRVGASGPGGNWDEREPIRPVSPGRGGLSFFPGICGVRCDEFTEHSGAGAGGGGFGVRGATGEGVPGGLFGNGAGGRAYGTDWFLGEGDDTRDLYGGSGGGGGGASTNKADREFAIPGTGGGGGGGCLVLAVAGDLHMGPMAMIDARGGDAFKGVSTGGNGGGGSGGAVLLRVNGNLVIERNIGSEPDARSNFSVSAVGGMANLDVTDPDLLDDYTSADVELSTILSGGDGANGRVRIEYPGGGVVADEQAAVVIKPEGAVPSVGTAFQGNESISHVWSKPIPLSGGPGSGIMFVDAVADINSVVAELVETTFSSSIVRWNILLDGGEAECAGRAEPYRLYGPMDDFENLQDVGLKPSYFRFMLTFVGSQQTGEVPAVERLMIPTEAVDYAPVIEPPDPEPPGP